MVFILRFLICLITFGPRIVRIGLVIWKKLNKMQFRYWGANNCGYKCIYTQIAHERAVIHWDNHLHFVFAPGCLSFLYAVNCIIIHHQNHSQNAFYYFLLTHARNLTENCEFSHFYINHETQSGIIKGVLWWSDGTLITCSSVLKISENKHWLI